MSAFRGAPPQPAPNPAPGVGPLTDEEKVELMTFDRLTQLGFSEADAEWLVTERVSWHDADDLIQRGCPVALAFDILR